MKTIINIGKLIVIALFYALVAVSCVTSTDTSGHKVTAFLGNYTKGAEGTDSYVHIDMSDANATTRTLIKTGGVVVGISKVTGATESILNTRSGNGVVELNSNNVLSGKINDNATSVGLEKVKGENAVNLLKATKPIIP